MLFPGLSRLPEEHFPAGPWCDKSPLFPYRIFLTHRARRLLSLVEGLASWKVLSLAGTSLGIRIVS